MCMACDEMQLYYAYLDMVEEQERRKSQKWECEVTVIAPAEGTAEPVQASDTRPAAAASAKPGFVCDTPE